MNLNCLTIDSNIIGQPIISSSGLQGIVIRQPGPYSKSKMVTAYVLENEKVVKIIAEARSFRTID